MPPDPQAWEDKQQQLLKAALESMRQKVVFCTVQLIGGPMDGDYLRMCRAPQEGEEVVLSKAVYTFVRRWCDTLGYEVQRFVFTRWS